MFGKVRDMYRMQKQAKSIKKELKNVHIEAEVDGVMVTIDGEQNVVSVNIPEGKNGKPLEEALAKAFNKAIKKSQQIAADKMKPVMGQLGMPGA